MYKYKKGDMDNQESREDFSNTDIDSLNSLPLKYIGARKSPIKKMDGKFEAILQDINKVAQNKKCFLQLGDHAREVSQPVEQKSSFKIRGSPNITGSFGTVIIN